LFDRFLRLHLYSGSSLRAAIFSAKSCTGAGG
jgi:hypothetical protein